MKKQRYCPFCEKTTEWTDDEQILFKGIAGCIGTCGSAIGTILGSLSSMSFDKKDYRAKEIEDCKCSKCHHTKGEAEQYQERKRNLLKDEISKIAESIAELRE